MLGTFSPPLWVNDPKIHHSMCVTLVPWCTPGSLTYGFLWNRWRGKWYQHSQCMRNPQFSISGKRPMVSEGLTNRKPLLFQAMGHPWWWWLQSSSSPMVKTIAVLFITNGEDDCSYFHHQWWRRLQSSSSAILKMIAVLFITKGENDSSTPHHYDQSDGTVGSN